MPTLLDERPQRRAPVLFGRALAEQQRAEAAQARAAQDERQFAQREQRMADQNEVQNELRAMAIDVSRDAVMLRAEAQRAKLEAMRMEQAQQRRQLTEFSNAARAIGRLDPKAAEFDEMLGEIVASNPTMFADNDNAFATMIKEQLSGLQGQRKAHMEGLKAKEAVAAQRAVASEAGLVPTGVTDDEGVRFGKDPRMQEVKGLEQQRAMYEKEYADAFTKTGADNELTKLFKTRIGEADTRLNALRGELGIAAPAPAEAAPQPSVRKYNPQTGKIE